MPIGLRQLRRRAARPRPGYHSDRGPPSPPCRQSKTSRGTGSVPIPLYSPSFPSCHLVNGWSSYRGQRDQRPPSAICLGGSRTNDRRVLTPYRRPPAGGGTKPSENTPGPRSAGRRTPCPETLYDVCSRSRTLYDVGHSSRAVSIGSREDPCRTSAASPYSGPRSL